MSVGARVGRPAPARLVAAYLAAALQCWLGAALAIARAAPELASAGIAAPDVLFAVHLVGLGFLTRVAAFFIACTMLTAVVGVHWSNGFFAGNRGYEYPLSLLAMAIALLIAGGGQASIDKSLSGGRR